MPFGRAFVHGLVNNLRHPSFQQIFMSHYASAHAVTECITLDTSTISPRKRKLSLSLMSESWLLEMSSSQTTAIRWFGLDIWCNYRWQYAWEEKQFTVFIHLVFNMSMFEWYTTVISSIWTQNPWWKQSTSAMFTFHNLFIHILLLRSTKNIVL